MQDVAGTEPVGLLTTLYGLFGPVGAVLILTNGVTLWWIKFTHGEHKSERDSLVSQIKDSERLRREDNSTNNVKMAEFVDKLSDAYEQVSKTLTDLRIAFASKGVKTDV